MDPSLNYPVLAKSSIPSKTQPKSSEKLTYAQRADKEGWSLQKRMENAPATTHVGMTAYTRTLGMCMRCLSSSIPVKVDKKDDLVYCHPCYDDPERKSSDCAYLFNKDRLWTYPMTSALEGSYQPLDS